MPRFEDFYFESSTGVNRIHARKCLPDGTPRGVVQIAHGIAEHIRRYDDFMNFLAENGFVAVGNDHLGHGESVESPSELGFFAESEGWDRVVEDMDRLRDLMRRDYPDLPYIFFGHSMGSFLTRTYLIRYPEKYDAAILSGTGHQGKALVLGGCAAASLMVKRNGPRGDGKALNDMAFGSYCSKIANPRTPFDWLSRDEENVDRYSWPQTRAPGQAPERCQLLAAQQIPHLRQRRGKGLPGLLPGRTSRRDHPPLSRRAARDAQRDQQGSGLRRHSQLAQQQDRNAVTPQNRRSGEADVSPEFFMFAPPGA